MFYDPNIRSGKARMTAFHQAADRRRLHRQLASQTATRQVSLLHYFQVWLSGAAALLRKVATLWGAGKPQATQSAPVQVYIVVCDCS